MADINEADRDPRSPFGMLMLDEPRRLALKDRGVMYSFGFKRITDDDWRNYFNGIHFTSRNDGKSQLSELDLNTTGVALVEATLTEAAGYAGDFQTRSGWQKKIPPRHSNALSWMLRTVSSSAADENDLKPFDPECIEVPLDALWSTQGTEVTMFKGLVHAFAPPTAEHKQRYFRASSASRVTGGKNGVTVYGAKHNVLIDLYDKLIIGVRGYGVQGRAIEKTEIAREMDTFHKVTAIQQIFSAAGEE